MNNELIGVISNEGALEGVIEDDNFNVKVQIMESGPRGLPGSDGYTPVKGVDYFDGEQGPKGDKGDDGYTPIKGVDYFDGIDGKDGEQGIQGIQGEQGPKGDKGDTGSQGEKGDKGDTGEKGEKGPQGDDGYTPQKGVDYWTASDKVEIVSDVLDALPDGDEVSY